MTDPSGIDAVIRAARAGDVPPAELFRALSTATLLLAGARNEDGAFAPQVISWEGVDYAAVFTSRDATQTLPDAPGFAEMTGRDLGASWPEGLGAAVNPGSDDVALVFDATAVRMLADPDRAGELGTEQPPSRDAGDSSVEDDNMVHAGEKVSVGRPAIAPPPEFPAAVRTGVRATFGADCAYIFQMVAESKSPRLMVGVVLMADADEHETMTALVSAVAGAHFPASEIDFMVLGDDLRPAVAKYADELR